MATSNYRNSLKSLRDDEPKPMTSGKDIQRTWDLVQSFPVVSEESFRHALNKQFTKSKLWAAMPNGARNEGNLIISLATMPRAAASAIPLEDFPQTAADGEFFWEQSEDYVPGTWNHDHKILQFASGERGATTYSFGSCGSIFNREFYNAEHTGENSAKAPVSLSRRMELICDGANGFLEAYSSKNGSVVRQVPQAYASHPFVSSF
ncbi:hypothetical protein FRC10_008915 [Ceratobasidium sp. 414]|nr:hypothetical protein FRC10_008915 [Ceratobasidium sp. 414]